jgi:hypothetical protein
MSGMDPTLPTFLREWSAEKNGVWKCTCPLRSRGWRVLAVHGREAVLPRWESFFFHKGASPQPGPSPLCGGTSSRVLAVTPPAVHQIGTVCSPAAAVTRTPELLTSPLAPQATAFSAAFNASSHQIGAAVMHHPFTHEYPPIGVRSPTPHCWARVQRA